MSINQNQLDGWLIFSWYLSCSMQVPERNGHTKAGNQEEYIEEVRV
jgi:hypothetical protein